MLTGGNSSCVTVSKAMEYLCGGETGLIGGEDGGVGT